MKNIFPVKVKRTNIELDLPIFMHHHDLPSTKHDKFRAFLRPTLEGEARGMVAGNSWFCHWMHQLASINEDGSKWILL